MTYMVWFWEKKSERTVVAYISVHLCLLGDVARLYVTFLLDFPWLKFRLWETLVAVNYLFLGVICMDRKSSARGRLKRPSLAFAWSNYF